ncbi:MAG: MFS transporter [Alphaproteobacteria bacterium]
MSQVEPVTSAPPAPTRASDFRWYLGANGVFFISAGIGMVMTPFILTTVLLAPPELVGLTTALNMLPLLLLLPFGGAKADRSDLRAWMMRVHMVQLIPPLGLAFMLFTDTLTLPLLIVYGVCAASLGAFAGPTRDSLLNRVADKQHAGGMQRAVGFVIGTQMVAQLVGISLVGTADQIGIATLPTIVVLNFAVCIFLISRMAPAPPHKERDPSAPSTSLRSQLHEIGEGFVEVWLSKRIRPVMVQLFFGSLLFMGSVMVLLPVMMTTLYDGGSADFSLIYLCLFGGIGISATLTAQRPIRRQGRALMLAMLGGGATMVLIHFHPPLWALYAATFFWGLTGGVSNAMSRTIVQMSAAPSHLARVLAIFTVAQLAGGPIGSFAMGYFIKWFGVLNAALVPAGLLVFVWLGLFFFSGLWRMEATQAPPAKDLHSTEPLGPPET